MTVQSKRMCTTENFEYCTMDSTSGTSAGMSGASRPSEYCTMDATSGTSAGMSGASRPSEYCTMDLCQSLRLTVMVGSPALDAGRPTWAL